MESSIHAPLREFVPNQSKAKSSRANTYMCKQNTQNDKLFDGNEQSPVQVQNGERKVNSMCKKINYNGQEHNWDVTQLGK
jgi:hypothetical protein